MSEEANEVVTPMRKRKVEPTRLEKRVRRAAKIITKHQKVLGDVGIDALKVATLQMVVKKLNEVEEGIERNFMEIRALLDSAGFDGFDAVALIRDMKSAPISSTHACALCGRPGVYQSRSARVEKGQGRPWYCEGEHANWARSEDGEEAVQTRIAPAAGSPNIAAALAALKE